MLKYRSIKCPPPSSSGPGRSPLKAQTGVRVPLGALNSKASKFVGAFLLEWYLVTPGEMGRVGLVVGGLV